MLLSSSGRPDGPIPPETRRVAGLLAREKTGEILAHLHRRPHLSASEVARLEEIHIATAQRYLKELVDAGLVGSRPRTSTQRPTEEYWLLEPRITIRIDLDEDTDRSGLAAAARRIGVRDRGPNNVVYDTDPRTGDVQGLLILSKRRPRLVEDRIHLSAAVGRFLAQLPYAAGHAQSVWDLMQRAGLDEEHLPEILGAIGRFTAPGPDLPASADPTGATDGRADTASLRPLDPDLEALFRSFADREDPLVHPVPILQIEPLGPAPAADAAPPGDPGDAGDPSDDEGDGSPPDRPRVTPEATA